MDQNNSDFDAIASMYESIGFGGNSTPSIVHTTLAYLRDMPELRKDIQDLVSASVDLPGEVVVQITDSNCGVLVDENNNPLEFA